MEQFEWGVICLRPVGLLGRGPGIRKLFSVEPPFKRFFEMLVEMLFTFLTEQVLFDAILEKSPSTLSQPTNSH